MTPVLAFHDLGSGPGLSICGLSENHFRALITSLKTEGRRFVDLTHLLSDAMQPSVVHVTLDDAFSSQLQVARAVLGPLGIGATAFVVTASVGGKASWDYTGRERRHADWDELAAWVEAGFDVGSHGHRHVDLRRLADDELDTELQLSRELLHNRLGVAAEALAYPFGRSDDRVRSAARRAGFKLAFSASSGPGDAGGLALGRVIVSRLDTPLAIEQRLAGGAWGSVERGKQAIVRFWAGGTPLWQRLRGDYR